MNQITKEEAIKIIETAERSGTMESAIQQLELDGYIKENHIHNLTAFGEDLKTRSYGVMSAEDYECLLKDFEALLNNVMKERLK